MGKNILIVVLLGVVGLLGYKLYMYRNGYKSLMTAQEAAVGKPGGATRTPPPMLKKGDELMNSSLAKYASIIFPGTLSDKAKMAINGFDYKSEVQTDGSTVITLTSKDSDDQSQVYTVKKGESLYFVEMSSGDDKNDGHDANLRDDYGIIVDSNGMVQ